MNDRLDGVVSTGVVSTLSASAAAPIGTELCDSPFKAALFFAEALGVIGSLKTGRWEFTSARTGATSHKKASFERF
ncbi:hypothetical protein [Paraburkholderia sp. ZP32-5]|uniref:hypothetical protein n=1 Tax=Paraburkholderia sp. ZP32-5 TaxID=2883245 RepID=UPI001F264D5C|nr:hypothetical protein [Paraburkholderia sp. ZP32-5]